MHHALRPIQLFVLAIATMALVASSALAQTEPLIHNQVPRLIVKQEVHAAGDVNCPAVVPTPAPVPGPGVTAGGCRMHMTSPGIAISSHLAAGGAEVLISLCSWEVDMRIDVAGEGYMSHHELNGNVASCTQRACGQTVPPTSEGRAWSVFMDETEQLGQGPREHIVMLVCLENRADGTNPMHCEVRLPVTEPTIHRYRFTAIDASGHGAAFPHCEVEGAFDTEAVLGNSDEAQADHRIEITHS